MAQKMIDEKVRVVESGPEPLQSQLRDLEQDADTDVESIGSQDTETSESEEELEVLPPSKKARKPRGKSSLDSTKTQAEQRRRKRKPQKETTATATPSPESIVELRSAILKTLVEIDKYASKKPAVKIAIRNRTRESITRHLHYEKDQARLTRMQKDASKLLALWET
ncbi:33kDa protein, partial [Southern Psittacara leucophthalmus aviadenovirus]